MRRGAPLDPDHSEPRHARPLLCWYQPGAEITSRASTQHLRLVLPRRRRGTAGPRSPLPGPRLLLLPPPLPPAARRVRWVQVRRCRSEAELDGQEPGRDGQSVGGEGGEGESNGTNTCGPTTRRGSGSGPLLIFFLRHHFALRPPSPPPPLPRALLFLTTPHIPRHCAIHFDDVTRSSLGPPPGRGEGLVFFLRSGFKKSF